MAGGAMVGAGVVSAMGALEQGQMTSQSLNNQANYLGQQASEAESQGQYDALRQQMVANQKIGTATASYGAAGVTSTSGSVMDVLQASHQNAELDRLNILHGADVKAINYENQASMDQFGAKSALYGSYWQALGDIAGGAVRAASFGAGPSGTPGGMPAIQGPSSAPISGGDDLGESAGLA